MRTSKVLIKDNKIYVYTDYPSRLYFETPELSKIELILLREELENYTMFV